MCLSYIRNNFSTLNDFSYLPKSRLCNVYFNKSFIILLVALTISLILYFKMFFIRSCLYTKFVIPTFILSPSQHWSYIYSSTFQLLLIGFDEEDVTEEQRLALEQCLHMLRNPATIDGSFAMRASTRVTSRSRSPVHFRHHGSGTKNGVSAGDGKARLGDSGKGNIK